MKKNFIIVSVLALALILSPLSGIGAGVSADGGNAPAAVSSVSDGNNNPSVSGGDNTPSVSDGDNTDPAPTAAPEEPTPTTAPEEPAPTAAPEDPTETPAPVIDELDSILDNTDGLEADEVVEALRGAASLETIGEAMKDSDEFRDKVVALEKDYAEQNSITVEAPEVSSTAKEYVDSDKVSVVGAAFSAEQGQTVNLHMDTAEEPENLKEISANYKAVSLDIKLYINGSPTGGDMLMPVTITMPVPSGLDVSKMVIRHYPYYVDTLYDWIDFRNNGDGTITFSVSSFSTFAFIEVTSSSDSGSSTPAKNSGSSSNSLTALEGQIAAAAPGTIIKVTKDQNINALSNSVMKQLAKRGDVALEMEYTYNGVDYHIVIPAGMAANDDIPWYGPLYLSANYSIYALGTSAVTAPASVYMVQRGDTLGRIARNHNTTVAKLAVKNPQIKNVNRIMPGQIITIE